MKHLVSTAIVAVIVSLLTVTAVGVIAKEPASVAPAAVSNVNAHRVDGRHAVGANASVQKRRNKLVATNGNGFLPSNIVKPFWSKLRGVPQILADERIGWGEIINKPGDIADGKVGWPEIRNKPAGFADGVDNAGVTKITITRVVGPVTTIDAGGTGIAIAPCPAGSRAVGGGFGANLFGLNVTGSFATAGSTTWLASADNPTAGSIGLQAVAQCMSTTPSSGIATAQKGPKVARARK